MWAVRIGPRRSAMGMGRLPRLLAVLLVIGHGHIIGMASGPNPSFNHPPGVSTSAMGGPLSGSTAAFVDSAATGPSSPSADSTPSPSMRLRRPAQGIMVPDMYATFNEGFHAAKSPDVSNRQEDCPRHAFFQAVHVCAAVRARLAPSTKNCGANSASPARALAQFATD